MSSQPIQRIPSNKRTLLITCKEDKSWLKTQPQIIPYFCLGYHLRKNDLLQQAGIEHYLKKLGCPRIIVARHLSPRNEIFSLENPAIPYQFLFPGSHDEQTVLTGDDTASLVGIEQLVLEQVTILSSYHFVGSAVEKGKLDVIGIVTFGFMGKKEIYRNGIEYNSLRTSS